MGFLDKIFRSKKVSIPKSTEQEIEHAVIIHFNYGIEGMEKIYELRDKLKNIIEKNNLGDYDGHEIATDYSDGFLYMYGPNAETLFNGIKSTLEKTDFLNGAKAKLRFGPPEDGIKEITVEIKMK
ncbi:hypothetical protein [Cellulophaga sp. Hel_I_12]|uniref:hypothetical protein n=1 Tax=Cellulophaga sp. Hel_I_12 TaxID=1249972 RepID=UPI00064815AD|nr:hypothetical protein [Cellulophaga sp. Hel_I_12]